MKEIRIIVAGQAGVGKSAVIRLIANALKNAGVVCSVAPSEDGLPNDVGALVQKIRLAATKKNSCVKIEERSVYRNMGGGPDVIVGMKKESA